LLSLRLILFLSAVMLLVGWWESSAAHKRGDYYNCSVLYFCITVVQNHKHTQMSCSYKSNGVCWFRFSLGYFLLVCFTVLSIDFWVKLSVPVQIIAGIDSFFKWHILCVDSRTPWRQRRWWLCISLELKQIIVQLISQSIKVDLYSTMCRKWIRYGG